jgi:hypothetical protein
MAFTYDTTTDRGLVRLLLSDINSSNVIFQDDEIDAFLTLEGGNIKRAAATGKEAIAVNQLLLLKVIKLLDIQTDGSAVARELRMQAKELRDQAKEEEGIEEGGAFDWAEQVLDPFSARERLWNQRLRNG